MTAPLTISGWMRYDIVRAHIERHDPHSILELGVGLAGISSRIVQGRSYLGVEPDAVSRSLARERLVGETVVPSLEDVEPERRFDLVCAFEVIEHLEDDHTALKEWASWVKPGGYVMLSAPAGSHRYGAWDRAAGHFRRYDRPDVERLIEAAGLVDLDLRHFGFPIGMVLEHARNLVASRSDRVERPFEEITADSARQLQPSTRTAGLTSIAGQVCARLQRPFQTSGRGTGLVLLARRPG